MMPLHRISPSALNFVFFFFFSQIFLYVRLPCGILSFASVHMFPFLFFAQ